MKVVYNSETKKLQNPADYSKLVETVAKAFSIPNINQKQKFFYTDEDGDTITVSTQTDLEEAYKSMPSKLKLYLAQDAREANDAMNQSMLDRSICHTNRTLIDELYEEPKSEPVAIKYPILEEPIIEEQPKQNAEELKKQFQDQMNFII